MLVKMEKKKKKIQICTKSSWGLFCAETRTPYRLCGTLFSSFCWILLTNQPTNIWTRVETWLLWRSSGTQWSEQTIFKNNLLVFMYKERKWSRKPNMSRKGKCTREYLYTALRMFAAPALEIKLNSESGNRQYFYNYTQEGGRERWHTWPTDRPTDRPLLANREENQKTSAIFISVGNCLVCRQH